MSEFTDDEIIDYVEVHSQTPRALFHIDHINHLERVAGHPEFKPGGQFYAWHYEQAKYYIDKARANQKAKESPVYKQIMQM